MDSDGFEAFDGFDAGPSVVIGNPDAKSGGNGGEFIDPASADADLFIRDDAGNILYSPTGRPRKRRKRRDGNGGGNSGASSRKNAGVVQAVETLSNTLMVFHSGIAMLTHLDAFSLEKQEAETLSKSLVSVFDAYDYTPDPRVTSIVGLCMTAGMIYVPRAYLLREQAKMKAAMRKEKTRLQEEQMTQQQQASSVVSMGSFGMAG